MNVDGSYENANFEDYLLSICPGVFSRKWRAVPGANRAVGVWPKVRIQNEPRWYRCKKTAAQLEDCIERAGRQAVSISDSFRGAYGQAEVR